MTSSNTLQVTTWTKSFHPAAVNRFIFQLHLRASVWNGSSVKVDDPSPRWRPLSRIVDNNRTLSTFLQSQMDDFRSKCKTRGDASLARARVLKGKMQRSEEILFWTSAKTNMYLCKSNQVLNKEAFLRIFHCSPDFPPSDLESKPSCQRVLILT